MKEYRSFSGKVLVGSENAHDGAVAGSAAYKLHELVETVVVSWDKEADLHTLEICGKLL